jgi:hypothetical protein
VTYQLLVYVVDVLMLIAWVKTKIIKKNTEALLDASKGVLEMNTEITKYMFMSRHQTAGQNH